MFNNLIFRTGGILALCTPGLTMLPISAKAETEISIAPYTVVVNYERQNDEETVKTVSKETNAEIRHEIELSDSQTLSGYAGLDIYHAESDPSGISAGLYLGTAYDITTGGFDLSATFEMGGDLDQDTGEMLDPYMEVSAGVGYDFDVDEATVMTPYMQLTRTLYVDDDLTETSATFGASISHALSDSTDFGIDVSFGFDLPTPIQNLTTEVTFSLDHWLSENMVLSATLTGTRYQERGGYESESIDYSPGLTFSYVF